MTVRTEPATAVSGLGFGPLVGGTAVPGEDWVYVVRASALIDDPLGATCYRNALNAGVMSPDAHPEAVFGRCALAGPEHMRAALLAARQAADEWGGSPLAQRAAVAEAFHARLREHADVLTDLLVEEGHPVRLARAEVTNLLTFYGSETTRWCFGQMESRFTVDGRTVVLRRVPDGVVCVQPPLNTPALSVGAAFQAVLAGNALVVRLSRQAPIAAMYLVERIAVPALADAGAPPGVLSALCTDPAQALETWLASPLVDDVLYFGDSIRGERVEKDCLAAGKKPVLELGGNDVVVVWRDAPLDQVVEALLESYWASGQVCCGPNIAVVHPDVADDLTARLVDRVRALRPGFPDDPDVVLAASPITAGYDATIADAREKGAQVLLGGRHWDVHGRESDVAVFAEPALLRVDGLARARGLRAVRSETFFPLLTVVVPEPGGDLLDEMLAFVTSNPYGLRNSLWARDPAVVDRFVRDVRSCGQIRVNDSHLAGVAHLSNHGGPGLSGDRFGELNFPMLRTSRLQGVSVASGLAQPEGSPYLPPRPRPRVEALREYPPGWPPPELPGGLPAPFTEAFQRDPYPTLHWLRAHRPVSRVVGPDGPGWLLTRYDDVRKAHTDPRVTCDSKRVPAGRTWLRHWPDEIRERLFVHLLDSDNPRHADLRAIMQPFFTPARQEQWRTRLQRLVDSRIDRVLAVGRADLMTAIAYPLGGNVLFSILGATPPDMGHLRAMIWRTADWNNDVPYVAALAHEVDAFVRGAVAEKRRSPGDDLISLLVQARDRDGSLSEDELHGQVMLMLVAGQDPSINSVGNSLHALLTHPDQLAELRADPSLLPGGVNELLRYESPLPFTSWRGTLDAIEFGPPGAEVTVPENESLFLGIGAANRDPARYPDPDRLDLRRPTPGHLAFGHGPHYCLGAHIGRMTAETAVATVLRRLPGLGLDGDPRWRPSQFERGLSALPVAW
ncbi:MAG: aldehyde dehydrogenase family protein [Saccharothrix sp.]|nr:aldehyde dehydrogenase family protein [Saccharothrix sp.]